MALLIEKAKWAVLSFRPVTDNEAGLAEAVQATGGRLAGPFRYFIEIYRWGDHRPDPADFKTMLVNIVEDAIAYSDSKNVLLKRGGQWMLGSIPT
jgi:hypothetical protein